MKFSYNKNSEFRYNKKYAELNIIKHDATHKLTLLVCKVDEQEREKDHLD